MYCFYILKQSTNKVIDRIREPEQGATQTEADLTLYFVMECEGIDRIIHIWYKVYSFPF